MAVTLPRYGAATGWQQLAASERARGQEANELWYQILAVGLPFLLERQAENEALGADDACVYCFRRFGPTVRRNRLNRYYCNDCDAFIRTTPGQAEILLPTLVVDIRNSTGIEQSLGADWVPAIRRFRRDVACTVQRHFGFVMNTGGDSLMAIFPPGFLPAGVREETSAAAQALAAATSLASRSPERYEEGRLPYGTGVHATKMLVFSVFDEEDDLLMADDEDPAGRWESPVPELSGPVSIDIAGDAIVVACELADAAPPGEAWITAEVDREARVGDVGSAYRDWSSKAGPVRIRSVSGH